MKVNKAYVFKIAKIVVFIVLVIFASYKVLNAVYNTELTFFSILLITGIIGLFFEMYRK